MNNYFKVLRPGINSTFQDLGRFCLQHLGIVASGCMDQFAFCISNHFRIPFEFNFRFPKERPLKFSSDHKIILSSHYLVLHYK